MKRLPGHNIIRRFFREENPDMDGLKGMRLLIVDDEERFLYSMEKLLSRQGYDVQTAANGRQCLDILKTKRVDVVVLDIKMPGLDGLETLERIKQDHPLMEVILLTGHATVESAVEGLRIGAGDFLMKPISASDLIEKITEAFSRRRAMEKKIEDARSRRFVKQSPHDIIRDAEQRDTD